MRKRACSCSAEGRGEINQWVPVRDRKACRGDEAWLEAKRPCLCVVREQLCAP